MQDTPITPVTRSDWKNAINVQTLSKEAVALKYEIDTAKTSLKKEYFRKKLAKVNKKVYALLAQLQFQDAIRKARKMNAEEKSDIQEELTDDSSK